MSAFTSTKNAIFQSIVIQITLVFISMIFITANQCNSIKGHTDLLTLLNVLIIACFVYAIIILLDTAKSVFIIIDYDPNENI